MAQILHMQHSCLYICKSKKLNMSVSKTSRNLDHLGMTASVLCAIHCALVPVFLSILPLLGLEFLANPWVEIAMILVSVALAIFSLLTSYRSKHRRLLPFMILGTGFTFIFAGHFYAAAYLESVLVPVGGFIVASAHLVNWRLNNTCTISHLHSESKN